MGSPNWSSFHGAILLLAASFLFSQSSICSLGHPLSSEREERASSDGVVGHRVLLSLKETPTGSNATFECSPSGPCVPCLYSEKNDKKYRCSETGYRIPLKCVEMEAGSKQTDGKKFQTSQSAMENPYDEAKPHALLRDAEVATSEHRNLLDDSFTSESGSKAYITYRSCIPPKGEEKLSVLGFEGIVLCVLIMSGSVIYFRRKRAAVMPGVGTGRTQMSSRF